MNPFYYLANHPEITNLLWKILSLFSVGVLENFLSALRIKFLTKNKKLPLAIVDFAYNLIYVYIITLILTNLKHFYIIIFYSFGYLTGDLCALRFDNYLDKLAKLRGIKQKRKKKLSYGKK